MASPSSSRPRATAALFGQPLHPLLTPFPLVCFIGALLTDLAYRGSANVQWSNFSIWLITAGLVGGGLAAAAALIDYWGDRRVRAAPPAAAYLILTLSVLAIELVNAFVHSRDGWTAVVPTGLTLSAISVALLLVSTWLGNALIFRHGVGVRA